GISVSLAARRIARPCQRPSRRKARAGRSCQRGSHGTYIVFKVLPASNRNHLSRIFAQHTRRQSCEPVGILRLLNNRGCVRSRLYRCFPVRETLQINHRSLTEPVSPSIVESNGCSIELFHSATKNFVTLANNFSKTANS